MPVYVLNVINMETTKKIEGSPQNPNKKEHIGKFFRKTALIAGLASASIILSAQGVKPLKIDTNNVKSLYLPLFYNKDEAKNVYLYGSYEVNILRNPKSELKITNDVILSIEDQKNLRRHSLLTIGGYSMVYLFKVYGYYAGYLFIFKNNQHPPSTFSDTLK